MNQRKYIDTEEQISTLGYGCMRFPKKNQETQEIDYEKAQELIDYAMEHGVNYYDTAYPYHEGDSEIFMGRALKKYKRESFCLADKMPLWMVNSQADAERIFEEQLKKCQVEYFDFYLVHAMDKRRFARMESLNIYDFLAKKKREKKIRYLGFSFHDKPEVLSEILDAHDWDFVQIQLNYLDWDLQDAKQQYALIEAKGIPCIVMEPVRGGTLAVLCKRSEEILKAALPEASLASWAIRYAASKLNVLTVLSGMSDMEQVKDNIHTMTDFKPLTGAEEQVLMEALEAFRAASTIPCTGCRYCMDCPSGVDIPKVFSVYNQYSLNKNIVLFKEEYKALTDGHQAHQCVACAKCMEHCPQGIQIPEQMSRIAEEIGKL